MKSDFFSKSEWFGFGQMPSKKVQSDPCLHLGWWAPMMGSDWALTSDLAAESLYRAYPYRVYGVGDTRPQCDKPETTEIHARLPSIWSNPHASVLAFISDSSSCDKMMPNNNNKNNNNNNNNDNNNCCRRPRRRVWKGRTLRQKWILYLQQLFGKVMCCDTLSDHALRYWND